MSKGGSRLGMCAGSVGVVVWLMLLLLCAETQGRSVGVSSLRLPTGRCSFDGGTCVMFCAARGAWACLPQCQGLLLCVLPSQNSGLLLLLAVHRMEYVDLSPLGEGVI
jgi:hypothetical protein